MITIYYNTFISIIIMPDSIIEQYIASLSEQELQTLRIAQEHLGTSFNMVKSIGFIQWKQTNDNK